MEKLRNYQVKLYTDNSMKPVAVPPRSVPYNLKARVSDAIDMLREGVIEEHPINDPSSWVSFFVFFNCYLAAPRPILGHSQVDRLNNPMLITAF